jgi:uracil-DNA glycosylase
MIPPIILLGEAWGVNEQATRAPFSGPAGIELFNLLSEAGVITPTSTDSDYIRNYYNHGDPHQLDMVWRLHPEVARLNVFNLHPPGNNMEALCGPREHRLPGYPALLKGKFIHAEFAPHLEALAEGINSLNPNLIIALGNTPLWALCGLTTISKFRGSTRVSTHTVADYKVLPTYHPSYILRGGYSDRAIVIIDLMKAKKESEYADIRRPEREIWIEPGNGDIRRFIENHIRNCQLLSVDIETSGTRITCIGFAPSRNLGIVIPFDDKRAAGGNYHATIVNERECWRLIREVLEDGSIKKLFQNGLYDIAFLWRSMKIKVYGAVEDTMLLHHALQPESLKGLEFLGSLYTDEGSWKSDHRKSKTIKRDS